MSGWTGRCDCCGEYTDLCYVDREGCETCRACHDGGQCSCHGSDIYCGAVAALAKYPELAEPALDHLEKRQLEDDADAAIESILGGRPLA